MLRVALVNVSVVLYLSTSWVLPRKMVIFKVFHHKERLIKDFNFSVTYCGELGNYFVIRDISLGHVLLEFLLLLALLFDHGPDLIRMF